MYTYLERRIELLLEVHEGEGHELIRDYSVGALMEIEFLLESESIEYVLTRSDIAYLLETVKTALKTI